MMLHNVHFKLTVSIHHNDHNLMPGLGQADDSLADVE